jgi:hypothetical protein
MSRRTDAEQPPVVAGGQWSPAGFRRANAVGALATVAFALSILVASQNYAIRVGEQPGPGLFPAVVAACLLLLGGAWLIGVLRNRYQLDGDVEPPPDRSALVRAVASFAVVGACAFALRPLGYPLTIALAVSAFTVLGGARWRAAALTGPLFAAVTFLLVTSVLGIQLPTGILRPLLVGLL